MDTARYSHRAELTDATDAERHDASTVAALAILAAGVAPNLVTTAAGKFLITDSGGTPLATSLANLTANALESGQIVQSVTVDDPESLARYVDEYRQGSDAATIFAHEESAVIQAVIDYHSRAAVSEDGADGQGTCTHVATLPLAHSIEWKAWDALDGHAQNQFDFVRHLEENLEDIVSPDAATVLEACRDIQAVTDSTFKSAVRAGSDNVDFTYTETSNASGRQTTVSIPAHFILRIPVYEGGEAVEVKAVLRWKVNRQAGGVTLAYSLHRKSRIVREEFRRIASGVAEKTEALVIYGEPKAYSK